MSALERLIVQTYEENDSQKVVLISHSMGVPYTLHLLNRLPQPFKDKYLKSWITISGACTFYCIFTKFYPIFSSVLIRLLSLRVLPSLQNTYNANL